MPLFYRISIMIALLWKQVKQSYFILHFPKIPVILICISGGGRKNGRNEKVVMYRL